MAHDHKEQLVPRVKPHFNPANLTEPLTAHEIDVLISIDGNTSVQELAHLKQCALHELQERLRGLISKGAIEVVTRRFQPHTHAIQQTYTDLSAVPSEVHSHRGSSTEHTSSTPHRTHKTKALQPKSSKAAPESIDFSSLDPFFQDSSTAPQRPLGAVKTIVTPPPPTHSPHSSETSSKQRPSDSLPVTSSSLESPDDLDFEELDVFEVEWLETETDSSPVTYDVEDLEEFDIELLEVEEESEAHSDLPEALLSLDASTSADGLDEFEHAAHVLRSLARVTSTFQLYDPRNDAVRGALVELHSTLNLFLERYNRLNLHVEPWELKYKQQIVYQNTEREQSLAFKLFRDGVRELSFEADIPWSELSHFLQILGMRYHGIHMFEDDIVTLLWKADFKCIRSVVVEGFEEDSKEDQSTSTTHETIFSQALNNTETQTSRMILECVQNSLHEEDIQPLLKSIKPAQIQYQDVSEHVLKTLTEEEKKHYLPSRVERFLDILEDLILQKQEPIQPTHIKTLLFEYKDFLLTECMLDDLYRLLVRTERWQTELSAIPELGISFQELCDAFDERRQFRRLLDAAREQDDIEHTQSVIFNILQLLPGDPTQILFALLEIDSYQPIKKTIRILLVHLVDQQTAPFVERMSSAKPDFLVELLHCIRMLQSKDSLAVLMTQLGHPDAGVQDAVVQLLDELIQSKPKDVGIKELIQQLVLSPEQSMRHRAYQLIQMSRDIRWASTLIKEWEHAHDWPQEELTCVALLAASLSPHKVQEPLLRMAEPAGRFMLKGERNIRKMRRQSAIIGLAYLGGVEAERVLCKIIQRHPELKAQCIEAMRGIRKRQTQQDKRYDDPMFAPLLKLSSNPSTTAPNTPIPPSNAFASSGSSNALDVDSISQDEDEREVDLQEIQDQMLRALQHASGGNLDFSAQLRKYGYEFVMQLHMLIKNSRLYEQSNRIFDQPYNTISTHLHTLLKWGGEIALMAVDGGFYINETRIRLEREGAEIGKELFEDLQRVQVGGFIFTQPLSAHEFRAFIASLARYDKQQKNISLQAFRAELKQAQMHHKIEVNGTLSFRVGHQETQSTVGEARSFLQAYTSASRATDDLLDAIYNSRIPNPLPIRHASNECVDALLHQKGDTSLLELLALSSEGNPLHTHLIEVVLYSLVIGIRLQLPKEQLADLAMTAFFHDVGHGVPPDPESPLHHTRSGMYLLLQQHGFQDSKIKRLLTLLEHHQDALPTSQKSRPTLFTRIIRIADTYSTLTHPLHGTYKLTPVTALQVLWGGSHTHFDPYLVQLFINALGFYPPGTLLQLSDGSYGISMGYNEEKEAFKKPRVLLVRDTQGQSCDGPIVSLGKGQHQDVQVKSQVKENPHVKQQAKSMLVRAMRDRIQMEKKNSVHSNIRTP